MFEKSFKLPSDRKLRRANGILLLFTGIGQLSTNKLNKELISSCE